MTETLPDREAPTFAAWKAEDAQIRIRSWNSIESQISSSLVYLDTAKQVWDRAKEIFSGVDNLRCTHYLHQAFFFLSFDELSLEAFCGKFSSICKEIDLSEPISSEISEMMQQRKSMMVARFLSVLPSLHSTRSNLTCSRSTPGNALMTLLYTRKLLNKRGHSNFYLASIKT